MSNGWGETKVPQYRAVLHVGVRGVGMTFVSGWGYVLSSPSFLST